MYPKDLKDVVPVSRAFETGLDDARKNKQKFVIARSCP
jgi:hypothetical protein